MADTVRVWRIASDTPGYEAHDLTGAGAKISGGRWNSKGRPVVYCSTNRSLACLETIVHFNFAGLPLNRYLVAVDIPEDLWARGRTLPHHAAPVGWDAEPFGRTSLRIGDDWLASASSCLLLVPSVIVPEEANVLVNPLHPDATAITAIKVRRWLYDPRLRASD